MNVRTRIAPSPTGEDLHIGNIYTGLLNFALAKKNKGQFIIRIEDTDRTRFIEGSEDKILKSLKTFKLNYDEGPDIGGPFAPYKQSERLQIYQDYTQQLIDKGHAEFVYYPKEGAGVKKDYSKKDPIEINVEDGTSNPTAPTSVSEMVGNQEFADWVVRMKVPRDQVIKFTDPIRGEIEFNSNDISAQVLLKSDGFPTYHLGVVVDDHLMEISHVMRAEEWISSTPKHILLYKYFGWELPEFIHIPLLRNTDKSKLSKRKNPVWASWYIEHGYLPEAVLNFLALLGWSHPEQKEIFSLNEFMELFDPKDLHAVGPVFDLKKLDWMNGEYIRMMDDSELKKRLIEFDPSINSIESFEKYIASAKTRMRTLADFKSLVAKNKDVALSDGQEKLARRLREDYVGVNDWNAGTASAATIAAMKDINSPGEDVYVVLTGNPQGIPFDQRLEIQGQQGTISWLDEILRK